MVCLVIVFPSFVEENNKMKHSRKTPRERSRSLGSVILCARRLPRTTRLSLVSNRASKKTQRIYSVGFFVFSVGENNSAVCMGTHKYVSEK